MVDRKNILSVDIGGSRCKVGLVDAAGSVQLHKTFETEDVKNWGAEGFAERLKPYEEEHSVDGISIGIPATVDWDHNHVRSDCGEVPWLADSSSKRYIQDELHRPVLLVNDVEAFLVGEWIWGELKGLHSGVVLSLGASMGCALMWNDRPQQGRRGSIMELENLSLDTYGEQISGYPPGSGHMWLSGRGLEQRMKQNDLEPVPLEEFFRTEDDGYQELRETFEDKLAHMIGNIVMMLDPERIVLGGGITRSHESWLPAVKEKMDNFITDQFKGVPSVNLAQLRGNEITKGPAAFWDWVNDEENS